MSVPGAFRVGRTDSSTPIMSSLLADRCEAGSGGVLPETHMPVHARQLPTNSRAVLDELVDPNARHERASSAEETPTPNDREAAISPEVTPPPRSDSDARAVTGGGSDLPWYRRESWLAVQILAIVPILSAMLVPETYRLPLCILGGVLVAVGTVMLLRHKPMPASSRSGSA